MRCWLPFVLLGASSLLCTSVSAADPFDELYDAMVLRTGADGSVIDPPTLPLWTSSHYLVDGGRDSRFFKAMLGASSLSTQQIDTYPDTKRAILQRLVWAVFDWTTVIGTSRDTPDVPDEDVQAMQNMLADVIRKLALSKDEIHRLPNPLVGTIEAGKYPATFDSQDPYAAFLPKDILDDDGSWVCLSKFDHELPAFNHTRAVNGRSAFLIFMRVSDDRGATVRYLEKLASFRDAWAKGDRLSYTNIAPHPDMRHQNLHVNPNTPQVPEGTQVALVERAMLISDSGEIVFSPLVTNVQIRAFLNVGIDRRRNNAAIEPNQAVAEFVLQPRELLRGRAAMRAIASAEIHHSTIFRAGDPFVSRRRRDPPTPRLQTCAACHSSSGIHSFNSRVELFQRRSLIPPRFFAADLETIGNNTVRLKSREFSWGLLNGLWRNGQQLK